MELEAFDRVEATFTPIRRDDLKPGVSMFIGWRGIWQAMWIIEDGPYAGQWAMMGDMDFLGQSPPFAWTPFCDLSNIVAFPVEKTSRGDDDSQETNGQG